MSKVLFVFSLLSALLLARENPFFPATGIEELPVTANITEKNPPLKRAAVTLPDSARVLQDVTLSYKNLDGSIATKTITVEQSIDWHLPLFISQAYTQSEQAVPEVKKSAPKPETVADFGFIRFEKEGNLFHVITKDPMLRNFKMTSPHRIVIDFESGKSIRSKTALLKSRPYEKVRIGNHDGYYRVVIELDGQYRSTITPTTAGISIECR